MKGNGAAGGAACASPGPPDRSPCPSCLVQPGDQGRQIFHAQVRFGQARLLRLLCTLGALCPSDQRSLTTTPAPGVPALCRRWVHVGHFADGGEQPVAIEQKTEVGCCGGAHRCGLSVAGWVRGGMCATSPPASPSPSPALPPAPHPNHRSTSATPTAKIGTPRARHGPPTVRRPAALPPCRRRQLPLARVTRRALARRRRLSMRSRFPPFLPTGECERNVEYMIGSKGRPGHCIKSCQRRGPLRRGGGRGAAGNCGRRGPGASPIPVPSPPSTSSPQCRCPDFYEFKGDQAHLEL